MLLLRSLGYFVYLTLPAPFRKTFCPFCLVSMSREVKYFTQEVNVSPVVESLSLTQCDNASEWDMYYIRRQKKPPPTVFLYVETIKLSSTPARNTSSSSQLSTTLGRIWVVIFSVSYSNGCDFTSSELDVSIEFETRRPTSVVRSLFNTLPATPSGFAEIKSQKPRDGQPEYFGHVVDRQQSQHVGCYATLVIDVELAGGCRSRRCPSVVSVDVAVYGLHG